MEVVIAGGFSTPEEVHSSVDRDLHRLTSNHDEADTRLILIGIDALKYGFERLIVVCRDTDVLILLLQFAAQLPKEV